MVTIQTYADLEEALMAQAWLESNGIESFIPDEMTASALPNLGIFSGVRLQVDEVDEKQALTILATPPSESTAP
jgi:hypothetical protein